MRRNVSVGVSFNREKLAEIDSRRGYLSRSKFILLSLQTMFELLESKVKRCSAQPDTKIEPLVQAARIASTPSTELIRSVNE